MIIDLEDSIAQERKAQARALTAEFIAAALARPARPRLFVRVNGLATGLIDADLSVANSGKTGRSFTTKLSQSATALRLERDWRKAAAASPPATSRLSRRRRNGRGFFLATFFRGASERLIGLTWGPEA